MLCRRQFASKFQNSEQQFPAIRTKLFDLLEINALGFEICMLNIPFFALKN